MQFFVGIDVSLDSSSICVIDERGVIIKEGKTDSDPTAIARFVRHKGRKIEHVGLETGSLSQWLHAGLSHEGFRVTVMEARHVRAAFAAMRVKTDRNDARGIAQLIRLGWFKAVHVKAPSAQETRTLLNGRRFLVDKLTGIENSMRASLRNFGLKMGQVTRSKWAARARELAVGILALELVIESLLRVRDALRQVAVAIVATVEKPPFLVTMDRIVGGVEIEDDLLGRPLVRLQEEGHEQPLDRRRIMGDLVVARRLRPAQL